MPEYNNTNKGFLFKNERKQSEKNPDYTGQLNVAGIDHSLAAWIKTSKAGKKFMSISLGDEVKKKETTQQHTNEIDVSDIPF